MSYPLPDPPTTPPGPPAPVPPLRPGDPPIALLVDYDGTIAQTDVSDALMAEFVTADWETHVAAYDAGIVGSRQLMAWEAGLITADPAALSAKAAAQPHDPGFVAFAEAARAAGIPVEVVSDGFGFFIEPALAALGVPWIPVVTAAMTFGPHGAVMAFPNGNRDCFLCGTCKRNRVLAYQASGRRVVFIGDGESDRFAAGYADVVWAKHSLERFCLEQGWPYERWTQFSEVHRWLEGELAAFRDEPAAYPAPVTRPLFCGAEVWGPGRIDPPPAMPQPSSGEGIVPG
ncbi:MAG TPA: HAD-IB family phosphatase [Candidatus Limnocylindrales bacterium]|nr:HAD-IB family phosphatase [Candidatus Limnocylindrales bacterium]